MQRFSPLVKALGESTDETSLLAMLLDDFYQETFHAPVVVEEPEERQKSPRNRAGAGETRRKQSRRSQGNPRRGRGF